MQYLKIYLQKAFFFDLLTLKNLVFICFLFILNGKLLAQEKKVAKKGNLAWQLSENPDIKLALSASGQVWYAYTQWNPGSLDDDGHFKSYSYDLSLRRLRLGSVWSVGDRFKFYAIFGENNYNKVTTKSPLIKEMDVYGTYKFSDAINLAVGKSTWDGLSRLTAPSTTTMLAIDLPLIAQPTLNRTDDITRNTGVFLFGDIGRLDYRVGIIDPYKNSYTGASIPALEEGKYEFEYDKLNLQYTGYFKYDFLEKERALSPNFKGTYLGEKKLLSAGLGFKYQKDALVGLEQGEQTYKDMKLWSADVFWDLPIQTSFARLFSGYVGYFNYDLGPDYIRMIGVDNPASGFDSSVAEINGKGNGFPAVGTGNSVFYQMGLLLGQNTSKGQWKNIQMYANGQLSDFDALDELMYCYGFGLNWYVKHQKVKFSLGAEHRPVFSEIDGLNVQTDRKWMGVLQAQFVLK
ncbi:hypothetical protein [Formosa sp. S-31]|uniref:hypothetical protein n=1 Tax=Formosa sp. S-31 TaxID=2790949 RepID=UPI003EB7C743